MDYSDYESSVYGDYGTDSYGYDTYGSESYGMDSYDDYDSTMYGSMSYDDGDDYGAKARRKAPAASANDFSVGTRKPGAGGRMYVVKRVKGKNGRKGYNRWVVAAGAKKSRSKSKGRGRSKSKGRGRSKSKKGRSKSKGRGRSKSKKGRSKSRGKASKTLLRAIARCKTLQKTAAGRKKVGGKVTTRNGVPYIGNSKTTTAALVKKCPKRRKGSRSRSRSKSKGRGRGRK